MSTTDPTHLGTLEALHEEAARSVGLLDFGDTAYRIPMQHLLNSYDKDADLTPVGVERTRDMLVTVLKVRLQLQEAHRQWPEARATEIRRPIFVTGLPRTGTTALHRLLCLDPGSQGMEYWLTEAPQPRPPQESWADNPDYQAIAAPMVARRAANPQMNGIHFISPDTVEECWRAKRLSMLSIDFQNIAHLSSYSTWLADQDCRPAYEAHRDMLQVIGLHEQDRRWVLKSPSHLFGLEALMATYPDALVVQTHRDPRTVVASVSSLIQHAVVGTSNTLTAEAVGRDQLDMWSSGARRFAEARQRYDPAQFVDVAYDDFVSDAPGVVAAIYQAFGIPLGEEVRATVAASHEESKTSDRRPDHTYRLSDFGLTEGDVDKAFDGYAAIR